MKKEKPRLVLTKESLRVATGIRAGATGESVLPLSRTTTVARDVDPQDAP